MFRDHRPQLWTPEFVNRLQWLQHWKGRFSSPGLRLCLPQKPSLLDGIYSFWDSLGNETSYAVKKWAPPEIQCLVNISLWYKPPLFGEETRVAPLPLKSLGSPLKLITDIISSLNPPLYHHFTWRSPTYFFYDFPVIFLWFSTCYYVSSVVFLWFSVGFSMISCGFCLSYGFTTCVRLPTSSNLPSPCHQRCFVKVGPELRGILVEGLVPGPNLQHFVACLLVKTLIHHHFAQQNNTRDLVGGAITILKNMKVSWEGWHPIILWKIKNVWNHQPVTCCYWNSPCLIESTMNGHVQ